MVKIPLDERSVYLAFKNVFKGPDVQPQSDKSIRKKIRKYQSANEEIQALIQGHTVLQIGKIVKTLLEGNVFASTLEAKIRFPEIFDVSSAQSAERAVSEAEAAKSEADAIREVTARQQEGSASAAIVGEATVKKDKEKLAVVSAPPPNEKPLLPENFKARSLYPLYLPAKSQRQLLSKVQDDLEHACFRFGQRKMVRELQKQAWDSPECVELNIWMGLFRSKGNLFDAERMAGLGKPFPDLLSSIAQIRHTAVHRLRVTTGRTELFLADAEALAVLLADESCARQLSRLRRETHLIVEEFGRNKDFLESQYMDKRKEIAARRAELDRIEQAAWDTMLEEDKQYQSFAGANLEEIIDMPETTLHSAAASEAGDTSEEDTSVESESEADFYRVAESSQGPLYASSTKQNAA
ncbi:hypothetical protein M3J09_000580 [Ascochyta lentis]